MFLMFFICKLMFLSSMGYSDHQHRARGQLQTAADKHEED